MEISLKKARSPGTTEVGRSDWALAEKVRWPAYWPDNIEGGAGRWWWRTCRVALASPR